MFVRDYCRADLQDILYLMGRRLQPPEFVMDAVKHTQSDLASICYCTPLSAIFFRRLKGGTKEECLATSKEVWTDMRP